MKKIIEKVIESYDKRPYPSKFVSKEINFLSKIHNKKILDAGCGAGRRLFHYMSSGADVTGIDQSPGSIKFIKEQANKIGLKPKVFVGRLEKTNFDDNQFDIVFCIGVLHHSPHPVTILKELRRVTKEDGKIVLHLYNKYSLENIERQIISLLFKIPIVNNFLNYLIRGKDIYHHRYNEPYWKTYSFKPGQGVLLLFKSDLEHCVEKQKKKSKRITIALNYD